MKVTVVHQCSHQREIEVKGIREARQYQKWLASHDCPACQEKQEEHQAVVQLIQMGIKQLNDVVFQVPSQTEEQDHIVTAVDGKPQYCSCKWYKNTKWRTKLCAHAEAVIGYIQEEQEGQALIASRKAWLAERKAEIAQAVA